MPASETAISSIDSAADGTRRIPVGPAVTPPRNRPASDSVPRGRHRARVGNGGRDGAEADPAARAEALEDRHDGVGEQVPAVVRLATGQDQQVEAAEPGEAERHLGPGERRQPAVVDLEGGAAGPVVEQLVRVEGVSRPAHPRRPGSTTRWSPPNPRRPEVAVESRHHDRIDDRGLRLGELVERHARRITGADRHSTAHGIGCILNRCRGCPPELWGVPMFGTILKAISVVLLAWFTFMIGAAIYAATKRRDVVPADPAADEVDLVAASARSTSEQSARSAAAGRDVVRRRGRRPAEATLDPMGATIEVSTHCSAAAASSSPRWNIETTSSGIGGVGDGARSATARPRRRRCASRAGHCSAAGGSPPTPPREEDQLPEPVTV